MAELPELGVGIVYSAALEPLLEQHPELFDVVELEPQTTWIETGDPAAPYLVRREIAERIARLAPRALVHSIGAPVGGTLEPDGHQLRHLRATVELVRAPWASEHLSFNRTQEAFTGFFLPPRQSAEGVLVCAERIRRLRAALGVPIAIETGVNYLKPRRDELTDGAFVRAVAETADCGILLDLHNAYTNQRNGRQTIERFLAELPLERVCEVHLAGGFELQGYWLDAHSGAVPDELAAIARDVLPSLRNTKALVFEVFSSFLPHFGLDGVRREMERLHELWELRGRRPATVPLAPRVQEPAPAAAGGPSPGEWEAALGSLVLGLPASGAIAQELAADPGLALIAGLVHEFRGSMVVAVHRLTSRLLMLALGPEIFRALLEDFWSRTPPRQFAGSEANAFADYVLAKNLRIPQLERVLEFERASLATLIDGVPRIVRFSIDPLPMLRALADGRLLENPGAPGDYEIEVTAEGEMRVEGLSAEALRAALPYYES